MTITFKDNLTPEEIKKAAGIAETATPLKLCPFCGEIAKLDSIENTAEEPEYYIRCSNEDCVSQYEYINLDKQFVINEWNRRPLDKAVDEKYKRILDALQRVKDDWKNGGYTEETYKSVCEALNNDYKSMFKCNWEDFKKVLETTNIIPIKDKSEGDVFTNKPMVYKAGEPAKLTGFASIYEEASIAPSKDKGVFYWPQSDDEVKRVPMHPSNSSNFVEDKEFPDVWVEKESK